MEREALKLALEALEHITNAIYVNSEQEATALENAICAITVIKAALAQPAQEPVAWWNDMSGVIDLNVSGRGKPLYTTPPQPAQEPVAWMYPDDYERMLDNETFCTVYSVEVGSPTRGETTVALYTAPPKRPWVGLTDEERQDIALEVPMDAVFITEAKLKEKNS